MDCDEKRRHRILLGNDMLCTCKTLKNYKKMSDILFFSFGNDKGGRTFYSARLFPRRKTNFYHNCQFSCSVPHSHDTVQIVL